MRARRLIGFTAVLVGVSLALASSAGAVRPPDTTPTPPPPTTTTGPSCPAEPFSWQFDDVGGYYQLGPLQQVARTGTQTVAVAGPGSGAGTPIATQTLTFAAGSGSIAFTTQGCWQYFGDPVNLSTSPFKLVHFATSQSVRINSMYLVPVNLSNPPTLIVGNDATVSAAGPDTRYEVEAPSNGSPTGPLTVIGRVDLSQTAYRLDPVSGYLGSFGPGPQGPTFAGRPITGGSIFLATDCGSARVAANLPLPGAFSTGPSSGPPPTGEADYNVSVPNQCPTPSGGGGGGGGGVGGFSGPPGCQCAGRVHAAESGDVGGQPIHLSVPNLYLGGLHIQNAFLNYDPSTDLWTGGGDFQLGDASVHAVPPPPNEGFGIHGNGDFAYGGAQYTFPSPGPLLFTGPPPVNLTEIGVTFALHPTTLSGDATISVASGEVTIHGTALVVFGDANEPYTYQPSALQGVSSLQIGSTSITSFAAGISGTVDLNDLPGLGQMQLGNGYVFYVSPGYFEFAGNVSQDLFGIVQAIGGVKGALDLHSGRYNLEGTLSVCANFPFFGQVCKGLDAVLSSTGIGACASFPTIPPVTIGFTYHWGDSLPSIQGPFSCDTSPIRVVVNPGSARDRAGLARAANPVGFDLQGGVPSTSVWVTGSGGPPRVTITGPHNEQLSNPDPGRGIQTSNLVIWPEPKLNETLIAIRHPSAGRWTITPLPDSPAITRVQYAEGLPAARIHTSIRGHGNALTLQYQVSPRDGQTVTFAERAGATFHVIGRAAGRRGSLRFTPAVGLGGRRQIVAMISLAGAPRENIVVGHYTAASLPRPATPRSVRVARTGAGLAVSWLPADRWGCLVFATLSDGRRQLWSMPPNRHSMRISGLAPGVGARITVTDLGPTGNTSAAAVTSLAPVRPGPVAGITVRRAGRKVEISWRRAAGATQYLVTITVGGHTPVTLYGVTVHPKVMLIKAAHYLLASGAVTQLTIRAAGLDGQEGPAGTARLALRGAMRNIPQPPPDRPRLRAVDAIE